MIKYEELQDKAQYNLFAKTVDWEVYRSKEDTFIIYDLVTGYSIGLDFDDVPQVFDLMKKVNESQDEYVDWSLEPNYKKELGIK